MDFSVNFAAGPVHVGEWITLITSAGITVMKDDMDSQMEDSSFLDLSLDLDEWELPILSTDWDDSFDLVPSTAQMSDHQGPSQPLPKVKPHTRVVRPRVEPRLCLQNGVPIRNSLASSSTSRCHTQLNVSSLQQMSELIPSSPDVPKSVTMDVSG